MIHISISLNNLYFNVWSQFLSNSPLWFTEYVYLTPFKCIQARVPHSHGSLWLPVYLLCYDSIWYKSPLNSNFYTVAGGNILSYTSIPAECCLNSFSDWLQVSMRGMAVCWLDMQGPPLPFHWLYALANGAVGSPLTLATGLLRWTSSSSFIVHFQHGYWDNVFSHQLPSQAQLAHHPWGSIQAPINFTYFLSQHCNICYT